MSRPRTNKAQNDQAVHDGSAVPLALPEELRASRALGGPEPERSARREQAVAVRIDRLPDLPEELDVVELRRRVRLREGAQRLTATLLTIPTSEFKAVAASGGLFALCEARFGVGRYRATWIAKDLHEVARETLEVPDLEAAAQARDRLWETQLAEIDHTEKASRQQRKDQRRAVSAASALLSSVVDAGVTLLPEQYDQLSEQVTNWLLRQPKLLQSEPPAAVMAALARRYGPTFGLRPWSPTSHPHRSYR